MTDRGETVKLNIGCGTRTISGDGWVNVDIDDLPGVDRLCDVRYLSSHFPPGSVHLIYASHVLEYFDEREVVDVLKGWRAVLVEGGVLRLAVPNLGALLQLYSETHSIANVVGPLYGRHRLSDGTFIFHKMAYDYPTLAFTMRLAGFRAIRRWRMEDTEHPDHDDGSQAYYPHLDRSGLLLSLNVEGTK